jgi:hypothetical protein
MTDSRIIEPRRIKPLAEALTDLPTTYPEIRFQLMAVSEEFHRQCATLLEPQINHFVQSKQPKTLDDFRKLARVVDDAARLLGLCIAVDGKPGVPCAAMIDGPNGRKPGFVVLRHPEKGTRPIREKVNLDAPWFSLIVAPANMETDLRPLREMAFPGAWRA